MNEAVKELRLWRLASPVVVAAIALAAGAAAGLFPGETASARASEEWIATWATAQLVMPAPTRGGSPAPSPGQSTTAPPPAADGRTGGFPAASTPQPGGATDDGNARRPTRNANPSNIPLSLEDQTIRMVVRASVGGRRVRIALTNMLTGSPLHVGAAHLALHAGNGQIQDRTDRTLSFAGLPDVVVPPGALLLSDPVDLDVDPLADIAVSIYLPHDTGPPTSHIVGLRTAYIARGNVVASSSLPNATPTYAYLWLSSVEVMAPASAVGVVAFGDSITDGYATTRDANQAWPTLLARRLATERRGRPVAVINQGISGNQVLRNGAGLSALTRFDRDVLGPPNVTWMILLEGINDINIRGRVEAPDALTASELIGGYRQLIARAHAHGIKVLGATLTPEEGVPTASARGEAIRQTVNQWIRTSHAFDAVVDFDVVLRDPTRPTRLRGEYDPGDHIHPNDLGNQAMANAFDLSLFSR